MVVPPLGEVALVADPWVDSIAPLILMKTGGGARYMTAMS